MTTLLYCLVCAENVYSLRVLQTWRSHWPMQKDVQEIILDARRLNEEVERLEREKEVKDNLAQAKSRQCDFLSKKVSSLTTELEEVKAAAHGKQLLLETKEQENLKLASVVQDFQHKLEIEVHIFPSNPVSFILFCCPLGAGIFLLRIPPICSLSYVLIVCQIFQEIL